MTRTMSRIGFEKADVYRGPLRLISAAHPIVGPGGPDEPLVRAGTGPEGEVLLANRPAKMLDFLLDAAGCEGLVAPVSGYRTRDEQRQIFADTLRDEGEEFTRQYVALPGCSEHETGLAIDLGEAAAPADFIRPHLPYEGAFARLRALAPQYGFVERYPQGKTHLTGIAHEPWHFRYVGWPHAALMAQNSWVLEEYIEELARYTSYENALFYEEAGRRMRIFTLRPGQSGTSAAALPGDVMYQLSGNNVNGVVVTVWQ